MRSAARATIWPPLLSTMGQYEKAEAMQTQVLATLESSLGREHPDVARILTNLAIAYQQQKRYADAEPLYQRALEIRRRPSSRTSGHRLDRAQHAASMSPRKNIHKRGALRRFVGHSKKTFGPDHPSVSYSLVAMGSWNIDKAGLTPRGDVLTKHD